MDTATTQPLAANPLTALSPLAFDHHLKRNAEIAEMAHHLGRDICRLIAMEVPTKAIGKGFGLSTRRVSYVAQMYLALQAGEDMATVVLDDTLPEVPYKMKGGYGTVDVENAYGPKTKISVLFSFPEKLGGYVEQGGFKCVRTALAWLDEFKLTKNLASV